MFKVFLLTKLHIHFPINKQFVNMLIKLNVKYLYIHIAPKLCQYRTVRKKRLLKTFIAVLKTF